jgi:hypothetical protein
MKQTYWIRQWSGLYITGNLEKKSTFYLLQPNCACPFEETSEKHWTELAHLRVCNFHSPSLSSHNQSYAMLPENHLLRLPKTNKDRRGQSYKLSNAYTKFFNDICS